MATATYYMRLFQQKYALFREDILTLPERIYLLCQRSISSLKSKYYFCGMACHVGNPVSHYLFTHRTHPQKASKDTWLFMFRYFAIYLNILF